MEWLERLRRPSPGLLQGHGPCVRRAASEKLDEYMEHRLMREQKLVAALDGGERSRAGLLAAAWDDVPAERCPVGGVDGDGGSLWRSSTRRADCRETARLKPLAAWTPVAR